MTARSLTFLGVLLTVVVLAAVPAIAFAGTFRAKAEVPFDFIAGTTQLKAGIYMVQETQFKGVYSLINDDGRHILIPATLSGGGATIEEGKLVFERFGSERRLAEIWIPGTLNYGTLRPSGAEPVVVALSR